MEAREKPPKDVQDLAARVEAHGGQALAVYREPVGDHWQVFVLLPIDQVAPTPYQRDLSPTHAKRLQDVVKRIDRFVDPIVAVSPAPGVGVEVTLQSVFASFVSDPFGLRMSDRVTVSLSDAAVGVPSARPTTPHGPKKMLLGPSYASASMT